MTPGGLSANRSESIRVNRYIVGEVLHEFLQRDANEREIREYETIEKSGEWHNICLGFAIWSASQNKAMFEGKEDMSKFAK